MPVKPLSLQDHFLNSLRRSKTEVAIFLVKGVKLEGTITSFDAFSLLLRQDGVNRLLYKHAMSTIVPSIIPMDLDLEHFAGLAGRGARPTLQDQFLAAAARQGAVMTVSLVNGVMLQGEVVAFNRFSMLMSRGNQIQLIYKHAVSTLQPDAPLQLFEADPEPEGASAMPLP